MSIEAMYNTSATTKRQDYVEGSTIKKTYVDLLSSFSCMIQPESSSQSQGLPGSFGKTWTMFCPVLDIRENDMVVSGGVEYKVLGIETFDFSNNPHCEVTLRVFKD